MQITEKDPPEIEIIRELLKLRAVLQEKAKRLNIAGFPWLDGAMPCAQLVHEGASATATLFIYEAGRRGTLYPRLVYRMSEVTAGGDTGDGASVARSGQAHVIRTLREMEERADGIMLARRDLRDAEELTPFDFDLHAATFTESSADLIDRARRIGSARVERYRHLAREAFRLEMLRDSEVKLNPDPHPDISNEMIASINHLGKVGKLPWWFARAIPRDNPTRDAATGILWKQLPHTSWRDPRDAYSFVPDEEDPATLGAFIGLVREKYGQGPESLGAGRLDIEFNSLLWALSQDQ